MKFTKKHIFIISFVAVFILFDVVLGVMLHAQKGESSLKLNFLDKSETQSLVSLDSNSKKAFIKDKQKASFSFTDEQKLSILKFFQDNTNASLVIRVEMSVNSKQKKYFNPNGNYVFEYGFMDEDEKDSIVVKGNEAELIRLAGGKDKLVFDVSLAFSKKNDGSIIFPKGFFVYSDLQCKILSAYITPSLVGYDLSTEIPFFAYSSNGGIMSTNFSSFDFTGASLIFASQNTKTSYMPEFLIRYNTDPKCFSTLQDIVYVKLKVGSENVRIKCVQNMKESILPSSAFIQPFSTLEITENAVCVKSVILRNFSNVHNSRIQDQGSEFYIPIRTDPGLMLFWNQNNWRSVDFELFEWDRFPGILFFDTRNYTIQDNFFRRMAFFAEKEGYKGRLLTDEELGTMHGFNALDYRPETLADYFNLAAKEKFPLNKEERLLKKICIENGLLIADGDSVKPGYGAIVSISRESYEGQRFQLINHEAWHSLYFIDENFKNFVAAIYYTMDPQCLGFLIDYFKSQAHLGYDTNDKFLMKNEFMAYMIQQKVGATGPYFVSRAGWSDVRSFSPELSAYVINTNGQGFEEATKALNDFVFDNYGLIAGDVTLVIK
ncbi:MAG: hypothetical protein J6X54_07755 [Treponema sp.]|nr:hypothetical protein [Treponema sp.]